MNFSLLQEQDSIVPYNAYSESRGIQGEIIQKIFLKKIG